VPDSCPKRRAGVDGCEELLPDFCRELCLGFGSATDSFLIAGCLAAQDASAAAFPSRVRAVS
jgi:hypothetical protein